MHEFSVCIALMEQVMHIAQEHRAERVDRIVLQIGPLSGVEASFKPAAQDPHQHARQRDHPHGGHEILFGAPRLAAHNGRKTSEVA